MPPGPDRAPRSSDPDDRVPTRIKVFYAAPYIAELAVGLPIYIWLPKFYADHLLVPLGLMAMAIAVARATDAITDPLMGWVSDRTRTRWGRRRPYILVGGLMAPLFYVMLFSPPASLTPTQGALWFAAGFTSLFLFATVNGVPMQALGVELTHDYHERARLFGVRAAFIMGGTLAGAFLPWLVDGGLGLPPREAMPLVAITVACVIWTLKILLVTQVRERPEFMEGSHPPLVPGVRQAFRNGPFRQLLFAYLVATLSHGMASVLLPFFIEHVLHEPDASRLLSLSLGTGFVVAIASLPLVVRLSRRFGKVQVWRAALILASATDIAKRARRRDVAGGALRRSRLRPGRDAGAARGHLRRRHRLRRAVQRQAPRGAVLGLLAHRAQVHRGPGRGDPARPGRGLRLRVRADRAVAAGGLRAARDHGRALVHRAPRGRADDAGLPAHLQRPRAPAQVAAPAPGKRGDDRSGHGPAAARARGGGPRRRAGLARRALAGRAAPRPCRAAQPPCPVAWRGARPWRRGSPRRASPRRSWRRETSPRSPASARSPASCWRAWA